MAISKEEKPAKYDGMDALATLITELGVRANEQSARAAIDAALADGPPKTRRILRQGARRLGALLAVVPNAWRREIMVKVAKDIKAKLAKRDLRRQYPALRRSLMLRIASWFYDEETIQLVFIPIVSDYIFEHRRARAEGRWKAFVVKVRYWHAFGRAMGLEKIYPWIERAWALLSWLINKWWGQ